jgi:hypothetical protein
MDPLHINATNESFLFKNADMVEFCFRAVALTYEQWMCSFCVCQSQYVLSAGHKVTPAHR